MRCLADLSLPLQAQKPVEVYKAGTITSYLKKVLFLQITIQYTKYELAVIRPTFVLFPPQVLYT